MQQLDGDDVAAGSCCVTLTPVLLTFMDLWLAAREQRAFDQIRRKREGERGRRLIAPVTRSPGPVAAATAATAVFCKDEQKQHITVTRLAYTPLRHVCKTVKGCLEALLMPCRGIMMRTSGP